MVDDAESCRGAMGIEAGVARTGQRLAHRDASVGAHVGRRFFLGDGPSGGFSNEHKEKSLCIEYPDAER